MFGLASRGSEGLEKFDNMVQQDEPEQARYIVTALRRGLAILSLFRRERRVITVPEIASTLKLSRATAFRMAYTLERDGYLQRLPNSHAFQLGPKVLLLGFDYLHGTEVVASGRFDGQFAGHFVDAASPTFVLDRGLYNQPRQEVTAGVPVCLPLR